jgi:hypothetical protein
MPDTMHSEPEPQDIVTTPPTPEKRRYIHREKIGPAFWTVASIISMVVNLILVVLLLFLGQQLFTLKGIVQNQVLGGLYTNFQMMDEAHIRTTIPVSTDVAAKFDLPLTGLQVPAKFDLPLNTMTTVRLTEDTFISRATLYNLNAGSLSIARATLDITLPAGTMLPVELNLTVPVDQMISLDSVVVPVDQTIPVNLLVEVDIPLEQTELHHPFVGLQEVVKPYYTLLSALPDSWSSAICGSQPDSLCALIMP